MDLNVKHICNIDNKIQFSKDGTIVVPFSVLINAKIHKDTDLTMKEATDFGEYIEEMLHACLSDFTEEIEYLFRKEDSWEDE